MHRCAKKHSYLPQASQAVADTSPFWEWLPGPGQAASCAARVCAGGGAAACAKTGNGSANTGAPEGRKRACPAAGATADSMPSSGGLQS